MSFARVFVGQWWETGVPSRPRDRGHRTVLMIGGLAYGCRHLSSHLPVSVHLLSLALRSNGVDRAIGSNPAVPTA